MAETLKKKKITDMVVAMGTSGLLIETLREVAPRFQDIEDDQLHEALSLTPTQLERLQKNIFKNAAERLQNETTDALLSGEGIEMPHVYLVLPYTSESRKNSDGSARKKLSLKTREPMKRLLNNGSEPMKETE